MWTAYHWSAGAALEGVAMPPGYQAVRLPCQAVLIAWAVLNASRAL